MTGLTRRGFAQLAGAGALALGVPGFTRALHGQGKPRAVVIGGGAGGATAARYIAKDSGGAIDVTLIEPQQQFTTCFFSNLYLGGFRDFASITHSYDRLAGEGIRIVHRRATAIDRDAKEVVLDDGSRVAYDRLVVAPGIDLKWDSVPGYSEDAAEKAPHAWKAGAQTELLRRQVEAMPAGGTFVMVTPTNPYRCPPGPYERVSMIAWHFKQHNPTARIVVLETKPSFSKEALFAEGWAKHYPGMIEVQKPDIHGGITSFDADTLTIETDFETMVGDVVNIIPAQMAGAIARQAGLAGDGDWCAIDPASMRSQVDEAIFVIGDAAIAGEMPKSAFSANSQAKVAAMMVRGDLTDSRTFPARYTNTCWSLIAADDDVKVGASYEPGEDKIAAVSNFISQPGEDAAMRAANYRESLAWYQAITADMFG